ncbi:MAG: DUF1957 domain-containing protein [Treponema sp.]|nr:DUF1957 domain-containing protein [Treponema sp.]
MSKPVISLVLHGHAPFVRHPEQALAPWESWLFESISETYIPLLEAFERLDRDRVPFRVGLSLSPTLCHMLTDDILVHRYLQYTDRQIEFGAEELNRSAGDKSLHSRVKLLYDRIVDKRILFTERYEKNILKGFEHFQRKGRVELLGTAATHAFLPFYAAYPEAIQAQFEVSIAAYRGCFGKVPQGFWLPELGWSEAVDPWLRAYNINYTIVDAHALVFARPFAKKGSFYPVRTPQGIFAFGRDFYASVDIERMARDPVYRYYRRDQGFELPASMVAPFLGPQGSRAGTGYKYWAAGTDGCGSAPYNPDKAREQAKAHARAFLDARLSRLKAASRLMDGDPLSLCAFEADSLGRFWHEGPLFMEALFRQGAEGGEFQFLTPSEYLCKQDAASFQTLLPEFSSWGNNGYGETWLDASNDWMYRHSTRALERMVELAERFADSASLKERALNQAARELLLALASDWPKMLYKQEFSDYARSRVEDSLRDFTAIYEALGSNYISTEWLTRLERRNNIFPTINYRVFRRKQQ